MNELMSAHHSHETPQLPPAEFHEATQIHDHEVARFSVRGVLRAVRSRFRRQPEQSSEQHILPEPEPVHHILPYGGVIDGSAIGTEKLPEQEHETPLRSLFTQITNPTARQERLLSLQDAYDRLPEGGEKFVMGVRLGVAEDGGVDVSDDPAEAAQLREMVRDSEKLPQQKYISDYVIKTSGGLSKEFIRLRTDKEPIEIPTRNFVAAQGFRRWDKGRAHATKREESTGVVRASSETVRHYASKPADTSPPIESVEGYIQPNGLVVFVTAQGSHRTAAAIMRGDQTIKAKELTLRTVKQNFVSLPEQTNGIVGHHLATQETHL